MIRTTDINFQRIARYTEERKRIESFIREHEYLGTIPALPRQWFQATDKENNIVSAVITAHPNGRHVGILGEGTQDKEIIIARGASLKGYKNSASFIISRVVRWYVENTQKRVFIGFGDNRFNEIGYVYQACNFIYLGETWGSTSYNQPRKKKYCCIRGKTKAETKKLLKQFKEANPKLVNLPYPK